jgi:hypothetical protein
MGQSKSTTNLTTIQFFQALADIHTSLEMMSTAATIPPTSPTAMAAHSNSCPTNTPNNQS